LFIGGLPGLAEELPVQLALLAIRITDEYAIAREPMISTSLVWIATADILCSWNWRIRSSCDM
jgi:hypothetical protein